MRTACTGAFPSTTSTTRRPCPGGGDGASASCGTTGAGIAAAGSCLTQATEAHITTALQRSCGARRNTGNVSMVAASLRRSQGKLFMRASSIIPLLVCAGCSMRLPQPGQIGIAFKSTTRVEARIPVQVQGQVNGQVQGQVEVA